MTNRFQWSRCCQTYSEGVSESIMEGSFPSSKKWLSSYFRRGFLRSYLLPRLLPWELTCPPRLLFLPVWRSLTETSLDMWAEVSTFRCQEELEDVALMTEESPFWWLTKSLNLSLPNRFWRVSLTPFTRVSISATTCYWTWWESKISIQRIS